MTGVHPGDLKENSTQNAVIASLSSLPFQCRHDISKDTMKTLRPSFLNEPAPTSAQQILEHVCVCADLDASGKDDMNSGRSQSLLIIANIQGHLQRFSNMHQLTNMQRDTLCNIVYDLLRFSILERPNPTPQSVYEHFSRQLLRHSIDRPPFSIQIFALVHVKSIDSFVLHHIISNIRLYQYIFSEFDHLTLHVRRGVAEEWQPHALLSEAVSYVDDSASVIENSHSINNDSVQDSEVALSGTEPIPLIEKQTVDDLPGNAISSNPDVLNAIKALQEEFEQKLKVQANVWSRKFAELDGKLPHVRTTTKPKK